MKFINYIQTLFNNTYMYTIFLNRTTSSNGLGTIAHTISTRTLTPIPIMQNVDSSTLIWDGFVAKSCLKQWKAVIALTSQIYMPTPWSCFKGSKKFKYIYKQQIVIYKIIFVYSSKLIHQFLSSFCALSIPIETRILKSQVMTFLPKYFYYLSYIVSLCSLLYTIFQTLPQANATLVLRTADGHSRLLLERDLDQCILYPYNSSLHLRS